MVGKRNSGNGNEEEHRGRMIAHDDKSPQVQVVDDT